MAFNKPFFSIITVSYNAEDTIEKTIKSVLKQTCKDYEYIIIDGKSTDKTVSIIKKYKEKIDYWKSETDSGIYEAMNKGIRKSKGKFLFFLNADDYFYSNDVLTKVKNHYKKNTSFPIIYGKIFLSDSKFPCKSRIVKKPFKFVLKGFTPQHQAIFMKKSVFDNEGLFNENYKLAGDYDLMCRCYKNNYKVSNIDLVISYFRKGGKGSQRIPAVKENIIILAKHFGKLRSLKFKYTQFLFHYLELNIRKIMLKLHIYKKFLKIKYKNVSFLQK